jgi:quercetin 2,3-dioxygenase
VPGLPYIDPFLLIDEMGPVVYEPGKAIGAPDHPHRGFETVTYIIDGEMEHEDSHGHRGAIRSGDVQWMTAGAGVIHSEMPSQRMVRDDGRMHGLQIWVNLPRTLKMTQPRYQEYDAAQLPLIEEPPRWVRVIAGEVDGHKSPIETTVPTTLLHVKLMPNGSSTFDFPAGSNAVVHAISGSAQVGGKTLHQHEAMLLEPAPHALELRAGETGFAALLLAGVPLREPVARYGPFVMNSLDELQQAFEDFRAGRFGEIARSNT